MTERNKAIKVMFCKHKKRNCDRITWSNDGKHRNETGERRWRKSPMIGLGMF